MQKLKKRSDLIVEEIEDEIIIYDSRTQSIHHLNPVATIIWELCGVFSNPKDIAEEIVNVLKHDTSRVEKDVYDTLGQLREKGLLE